MIEKNAFFVYFFVYLNNLYIAISRLQYYIIEKN